MKQFLTTILSLLLVVTALAQTNTTESSNPTAATSAKQEWFDPTRKPEKVKEDYHFSTDWRIEVGYTQDQQRSNNDSYANPFLHGIKIGATVDFNLPYHFSVQTGLFYTCNYGRIEQHWSSISLETQQIEYIRHGLMEHRLGVPVRAFYRQPLWKKLSMFFYGGPKFEIGLAAPDYVTLHLSNDALAWLQQNNIPTENHDRYTTSELYRFNVQLGVGGGFEWDKYRLQAGYDFGLNNLVKTKPVPTAHMWEWGWYVSFAYKF